MYAVIETGGKQHKVEKGMILSVDLLKDDVGKKITFDNVLLYVDGKINIGIYGKNLSNEVKHGGDTNLSFGGTFAPLAKGKIVGAELVYKF